MRNIACIISLILTACGADLKYNEDAPPVHTSVRIRARTTPDVRGTPLPGLVIYVRGGKHEFKRTCPQLFGRGSCGVNVDANSLHAGDELQIEITEWACVTDCTVAEHTFTLPENGRTHKSWDLWSNDVKVSVTVTPRG